MEFTPADAETIIDFGADVRVFPDVRPDLALTNDAATFADSLVRLIFTPVGSLAFHPDRGFNVRDFLNDDISDETLFLIQSGAKAELESDERVEQADVTAEYFPGATPPTVRLSIAIQHALGPFELVLDVSALTATLVVTEP